MLTVTRSTQVKLNSENIVLKECSLFPLKFWKNIFYFSIHQNGSSECCRIILQDITGATLVNYKDFSGKCALHYAAAAGNVDVIKLLSDVENISIEPEDPDDRLDFIPM